MTYVTSALELVVSSRPPELSFGLVDTPSASVLEQFMSREALLSMTILYG